MSDSVRPHRQLSTRLCCPWDSPGKNTGVGCHFLLQCLRVKNESEVAQSCPTLWDLMDCSLPDSSIHGIFQARVLEWVAIAFSLLVCEMTAIVWLFEHSLALPFFGIGMKADLFQSCGHCWVFQICDIQNRYCSNCVNWNFLVFSETQKLRLFLVFPFTFHSCCRNPVLRGRKWW